MTPEKAKAQMRKVHAAFMERPKSMLDVAMETGIFRANICRYVAKLREANKIMLHHHGVDARTGMRVGFYTSDPDLMSKPQNYQLSLFD